MKRFWVVLLFLIPAQAFSVSNLKLNGASTTTITSLPAEVVITCNLAAQGNEAVVEIFYDLERNGILDFSDDLASYFVITDGIGWIINPDDRYEDILGDENGRDGSLLVTSDFEGDLDIMTVGQFIVRVTDQDGSTETAILIVNIQKTAPFIEGKVTNKSTGAAVPLAVVIAEDKTNENKTSGATTDLNGDYSIDVEPGSYMVTAYSTINLSYKGADSTNVTVAAGETKIVNLQMEPYPCFVEGYIKKEDNTPIANVILTAQSTDYMNFEYYFSFTNEEGYYKFGVEPGEYIISVPSAAQTMIEDDVYIVPDADTVEVSNGQTATANFTAKEFTTFITGTCTLDGNPLPDVEIFGHASIISEEPPYYQTFVFEAMSNQDGTYRLGIHPGVETLTMLTGDKDYYTLVDPEYGYQAVPITQGQTMTGYDFDFTGEGNDDYYISGQVTFQGGGTASDVYVVAINDLKENRSGYRTAYTDASGYYRFSDVDRGDWKVGVYKAGYHSDPYMSFVDTYIDSEQDDVDFVLVEGEVTDVNEFTSLVAPDGFELTQNYPNPFNLNTGMDFTSIRFSLDQRKDVEFSIFNIQGQLVKKVNLGLIPKGTHNIQWDGRGINGTSVPSGTYFYRVKANNQVLTKKMTIIR